MTLAARANVDRIEALIHRDVGRNITVLLAAARGGLLGAASALATAEAPVVGLVTGFYVPGGEVPAAETDGPGGAALLALAFHRLGFPCRLLTDTACRSVCTAALKAAGVGDVPVDAAAPGDDLAAVVATWRQAGVSWALAIERCGRTADGTMRNMRGQDIGADVTPLDDVFVAGPWRTIAIGDGGNEIGMGSLPAGLIAGHVAHGARIACVTPADHLVMAGVSHWGAYALLGALAVLRPDWRTVIDAVLDPELDRTIIAAMVAHGPAVDGVTRRRAPTIDSLPMNEHGQMLNAIAQVVATAREVPAPNK